jgi:hypothetical protein
MGIHSSKWSVEEIEEAHSIVNDIAEDIDNKESRKVLRKALTIYADLWHDSMMETVAERDKLFQLLLNENCSDKS